MTQPWSKNTLRGKLLRIGTYLFLVAIPLGIYIVSPRINTSDNVGKVYGPARKVISALETYRAANTQYPKNLEDLTPSYLSSVPQVKFGSRRWKYSVNSDATTYSLGVPDHIGSLFIYTYKSDSENWNYYRNGKKL